MRIDSIRMSGERVAISLIGVSISTSLSNNSAPKGYTEGVALLTYHGLALTGINFHMSVSMDEIDHKMAQYTYISPDCVGMLDRTWVLQALISCHSLLFRFWIHNHTHQEASCKLF